MICSLLVHICSSMRTLLATTLDRAYELGLAQVHISKLCFDFGCSGVDCD